MLTGVLHSSFLNSLQDFLTENDVPLAKVVGLGTDGAAVMTGKHNGVGVKLGRESPLLIHVHCVAHRLALAVSQSAKGIPELAAYQVTTRNIYYHFENSAIR